MVIVKTKLNKHISDNEKRRLALKEKANVKNRQSEAIKEALSNSNLHNSASKKKIFNDDSDEDENKNENKNGHSKPSLFDGLSSDDEHYEIKEKSQFEGKKGFELLNLQSTYGNDERFKISEKFLENDEENSESCSRINDGEKAKEIKILESVLNQQVTTTTTTSEKKNNKRTYEMLRYDATNKDHLKYEITPSKEFSSTPKKRKKGSKMEKASKEQEPSVEVSKEKFYEVSSDIKNSFKSKPDESSFSLLQAYGQSVDDNEKIASDEEYEAEETKPKTKAKAKAVGKPFNEQSDFYRKAPSEEKVPEKEDVQSREESKVKGGAVAKGIWKESFFFLPNDPRLKEGLEFINKMDSEEAKAAYENYDATRRKLKEILRLHMKKVLRKKDPFKNKVGGMSKKQLINSKYKNKKPVHRKKRNQ